MSNKLNLDFRPDSYWSTDSLLDSLQGSISGTMRRKIINDLLEQGEVYPVIQQLLNEQLPADMKSAWERLHPTFMGGEYLPARKPGEVEIARLDLQSTTADVFSFRARPTRTRIYYRLVDEYNTDYTCRPLWSRKPLTLGQLIGSIDQANGLDFDNPADQGLIIDLLESNMDSNRDPEELRHFVTVTSDFYPDITSWYEQEIERWISTYSLEVTS